MKVEPTGTIGELLARQAAVEPDRLYISFENREMTWGELDTEVTRAARGLYDVGVRHGDRVAILMRNRPEYVVAWLAIVRLGAVYVPIIVDNTPHEVDHVLTDAGVSTLVTTADLLEPLGDLRRRCPDLRRVVVAGDPANARHGAIAFDELLMGPAELVSTLPVEEDIAQIAYTSGTTSKPKGVVHTHHPYVRVGVELAKRLEYSSEDRLLIVLPMFHGNAQLTSMMPSLAARASVALMPRFSATRFWHQAKRHGSTNVNLLHGLQSMLLAQPEVPEEKQHSIRFAWGTTTEAIERRFRERFGIPMVTTFCLTECALVTNGDPHTPYFAEWAGYAATDDTELRIVDDEWNDLSVGETGVICVRNSAVMQRYHNDPDETAKAVRDGWLYTGDRGYMDERGNLFYKGRLKHVIRRSGENIAGEEVEAAVTAHPLVTECAAIAITDDVREEEIKVFVIRNPGADLSEEQIIDWCEERLASFKVPRYIDFRESLPVTGRGTVKRFELSKESGQTDCWDRVRERYKIEWRAGWRAGNAV